MPPRFDRVALGGTFDRFHAGHAALLRRAFATARVVLVGVTSDDYLRRNPKRGGERLRSYPVRARSVRRWLARRYPRSRWTVTRIEDRYGRAVEPGYDALVVSPETRAGGRAVNAERRRRGLAVLPLVEVPYVLGDDLLPLSSTRIRQRIVSPTGRRLAGLSVGIVGSDDDAARAVRRAVLRCLPTARVDIRVRKTSRPSRPASRTTAARWAEQARTHRDLGVGVFLGASGTWAVAVHSAGARRGAGSGRLGGLPELRLAVATLLRPGPG